MSLEERFAARLRQAIEECRRQGYPPNRFQQMLHQTPAVALAQKLVTSGEIHEGLRELVGRGRADLTVEGIMLEAEFHPLFKEQHRQAARWRIESAKQPLPASKRGR